MNEKKLRIIHALPGRLRIKLYQIKREPQVADFIQKRLSLISAIHCVEINEITGSILIQYDPEEILKPDSLSLLSECFTVLFPEDELNPNILKELLTSIH